MKKLFSKINCTSIINQDKRIYTEQRASRNTQTEQDGGNAHIWLALWEWRRVSDTNKNQLLILFLLLVLFLVTPCFLLFPLTASHFSLISFPPPLHKWALPPFISVSVHWPVCYWLSYSEHRKGDIPSFRFGVLLFYFFVNLFWFPTSRSCAVGLCWPLVLSGNF